MAHPDLILSDQQARQAALAFREGDERRAAALLARARDAQQAGSVPWARLERLHGLVLIHVLREVEGTFALERADAVLDAAGVARPTLEALQEISRGSGPLDSSE